MSFILFTNSYAIENRSRALITNYCGDFCDEILLLSFKTSVSIV